MQNHPQPPRLPPRSKRPASSRGRWWKRYLLAIGAVAAVASAAALIRGAGPSREIGPKLTHTVTRGDLIITVAEQGTLESAENTEIKCKVRGQSTVIWVIEGGTAVKPGDELVKLDTLAIEEALSERTKYAHWSRSAAERTRADVARAKLAISEYQDGRYRSQLMTMDKDLAIAESNLRTARNMLGHTEMLAQRGYVSALALETRSIAVTRAKLNVEVKTTEIDALKDFTNAMQLETLKGDLNTATARLAADEERAKIDAIRRDEALEELDLCVIKAERGGLVIHPSSARWRTAPEITEGASVHKEQVLLLMPDLSQMQVKIGIHESIVDRIKPGQAAQVTLPDKTLDGEVFSVASVTRPASWWNGNVVAYDTIIELPDVEGLKPGMSAEVEITMDRHEDVLTIPVAAVVETAEGNFCWVKTAEGAQRCSLVLGDTNDVFTIVEEGLKEEDEVVLNAMAFIDESQLGALKPLTKTESDKKDPTATSGEGKPQKPSSGKEAGDSDQQETKPQAAKAAKAGSKPSMTGAQLIKLADKNGDGVLTVDEFAKKNRGMFGLADTNQDGSVDASELDAALKRLQETKPK